MKVLGEARELFAAEERSRRSVLTGAERLKEEGNDLFKSAHFEKALPVYTRAFDACADKVRGAWRSRGAVRDVCVGGQEGDLAMSILNNRAACNQQIGHFDKVCVAG